MLQSRNSLRSLCKHRSLITRKKVWLWPAHPLLADLSVSHVGLASHSWEGGLHPFYGDVPTRFNICDNKSRLKRWLFNLLAVSVCGRKGDWYNELFWWCSAGKWVAKLFTGGGEVQRLLSKLCDRSPDKVSIIKFLYKGWLMVICREHALCRSLYQVLSDSL